MMQFSMQTFNFQTQLQELISERQLLEINFNLLEGLSHLKGYLLDVNDEYLLMASITNDLTLQGVTMCLRKDVISFQIETNFLMELQKGLTDDEVFQQAIAFTKKINATSFLGFISALECSPTLVTIVTETESYTGRVISHDDEMLVLDEYYAEDTGRFARTFLNPSHIISITTGGAWLGIIERSLQDKQIA
jgi:hypothetical protein